MAAPSKSFTIIPDADIDPDSPVTTGLMTNIRDDLIHLEEWLGKNFVAAQNHDHDDVNSALLSAFGGGALRLKQRQEVTADTADVTFSGLAGETDEAYIIAGRIRSGNVFATSVDLRPNGLTANQSAVSLNSDGTTVSTGSVLTLRIAAFSGGPGTFITFKAFFFARRTIQTFAAERQVISHASFEVSPQMQNYAGRWDDNSTIVTSIVVHADSTGIGKGSNIALYILRQS